MTLRSTMLGLLLIAGAAPVAHAQPRRSPPAEVAAPDDGALGAPERREQIKKKIRAMRAFTLTDELGLDEQTASRLFPVLARFDDETDKLLQRRVELNRKLRHADTMRDPRQIERLLDDAVANLRAFRDLDDRKISELRRILPPPQMARLLVVLPALERKIQNQLRKAVAGRGGGGKAKQAPVLDDDDEEPDERPSERPMPRRVAPPSNAPSNAPGNTPPCDPRVERCR